jgi:hypothetical protein
MQTDQYLCLSEQIGHKKLRITVMLLVLADGALTLFITLKRKNFLGGKKKSY